MARKGSLLAVRRFPLSVAEYGDVGICKEGVSSKADCFAPLRLSFANFAVKSSLPQRAQRTRKGRGDGVRTAAMFAPNKTKWVSSRGGAPEGHNHNFSKPTGGYFRNLR